MASTMIDQLVGSYRIVAPLGAGGMGTVWLAEHTLLGRRVAIKFLHPEISRNASTVERFFAEARAASRISDPGIVVIYDFGWHTDNSAYIVMEHLAGESLAARLHAVGRLPLVQAVHTIEQAAMAMAVAHAAGIIHRDLKPDNIFLIPDPVAPGGERVKLLDFGIAKLIGSDLASGAARARTSTGLILGTPMYMSPEQCRGAGNVDHRTDIYALGCVFFHLLCGREPFMAITPGDLIAAHLREPAPPPSTFTSPLPPAIDRIVLRCLAKHADDRYASMTELVRDLRAAAGLAGPIPTIAPLRIPHAPPPTATALSTLGTSAGESLATPPARAGRRLGILLAILSTAALGTAIGVAVARRSSTSDLTRPAHTTTVPAPPPTHRDDAAMQSAPAAAPTHSPTTSPPPPAPVPRANTSSDPARVDAAPVVREDEAVDRGTKTRTVDRRPSTPTSTPTSPARRPRDAGISNARSRVDTKHPASSDDPLDRR